MAVKSVPNSFTLPLISFLLLLLTRSDSAPQPFRRDPGHPQWHHGAFHDVRESVRSDVRHMLHTRAEVPFQVPLEVNVVLVGFNGDGGYRYSLDVQKLEEFLKLSFPTHRPSCLETGELLDIEHHLIYNVFPAGQPEMIALEKALKEAMVPAGTARETDFGREVPLFEVEATAVEPIFHKFYSYIFDTDTMGFAQHTEPDRPNPASIFVVNFDKVRMDPRNKEVDLDKLMFNTIDQLSEEDMKKQEGDYIYRYRYNGGGATQEKASHVHERPVVNWLLAAGCHPFGPFSNSSRTSKLLQDVALRNTIYARVDAALHKIRDTSEIVQVFASEHLKTPLGEPVRAKKNKTTTELWLEKFYKKTTNLPEPFPHELVERLEKYLDNLEEQLVDLSSLLYDHRLQDAHLNSSEILQSSIFTQQYVEHVLSSEKEKMKCCKIEYKYPYHSSQTYVYGGILLAGFVVYFLVIFFSNPVRWAAQLWCARAGPSSPSLLVCHDCGGKGHLRPNHVQSWTRISSRPILPPCSILAKDKSGFLTPVPITILLPIWLI
ncbi:unnamed protein product [Linum tenue]|uniref:DUF7906 domain-containing protein n=1 Tax=Linum tenue TaxID=586396 RepID=A0AAV0S0A2_9ROSI|nr:unnamed protein product [Linum tenue]